jgi:peptidoglycan-associated lipoprotein
VFFGAANPPQCRHQITVTSPQPRRLAAAGVSEPLPVRISRRRSRPSYAPGGPLQRNLGNKMSNLQFVSSRATLASAALLSLALLAGCQSKSGTDTVNADSAATGAVSVSDPAPQPLPFASQLQNVGDRVHFALDRYDLAPDAEATLQQQAALLQSHPEVSVTIQGHADERGTREYNLALGARRAQAVKDYLASLGVAGARLDTISFGKERPVCVESNDACWQQNRRGVSTIKSGAVS